MTWKKWSSEGKLNIDSGSPICRYLNCLGSDCGPGIYAYKTKIKEDRKEYKILIKKLNQFGGSDDPHLLLDFNIKSYPPLKAWHYKDDNGKYLGSLEANLISLLLGYLLK